MRGILNRQARRWRPELSTTQADEDMQRGNPVLLRLTFLAAIVCPVLRVATFSGVDRGGPLWETGLIPVRSILTISDEKPNKRVRDGGSRGAR